MGVSCALSGGARSQCGRADIPFLEQAFQKLLLNFTWWLNRKDATGRNVFQGGFLGLDNVGVFDRCSPLRVDRRASGAGRRDSVDVPVLAEHAADRD